jgi:exonuclease III
MRVGHTPPVRLITWNVAGRVRRRAEQVEALLAERPDVVALQEVSLTTLSGWREDLEAEGYSVRTSLDGMVRRPVGRGPRRASERRRPLGVLVAAPQALRAGPEVALPWPERLLVVRVAGTAVYNLHSPVSQAPGLAKVLTHEAVHAHLARRSRTPRVLCGDLNTPQRETLEGEVMTFARTSSGRVRPERGERHDRAELSLIRGLEGAGFRDAFRSTHGYGPRDRSWTWPNGGGYRLDHVIVTEQLEVRECRYLHGWREGGLSDHSGLLAVLERR